jgi:hypothetical protein
MRRINSVAYQPATVLRRLQACGELCSTWVQTCVFALDGEPPDALAQAAYFDLLNAVRNKLAGVHLYGLARPSTQPEAARLRALPAEWLDNFAQRIREKTGLTVRVSL